MIGPHLNIFDTLVLLWSLIPSLCVIYTPGCIIHKLFTVRYMRCFLNIYSTVSDAFMKLLWHNLQPNATTWTIIAKISWHPHEIIPWGLTCFGKMSVTPPPIAMLLQTTHRYIHGEVLSKNLPLPKRQHWNGERGTKQCIRKRLMCVRANNFGNWDCSLCGVRNCNIEYCYMEFWNRIQL